MVDKQKSLRNWKQIPIGGMIKEAGNSKEYKTGSWRAFRPIIDEKKCIHCARCVVYCPENCIGMKNGKRGRIDLDYCKGCLICMKECPVKAITSKEEAEFNK